MSETNMSEAKTDVFKFLSLRPPEVEDDRQVWRLFYRDQKVAFGSNTPPVIKSVENCLETDIKIRNGIIKKAITDGRNSGIILSLQNFIDKFPIADDNIFYWLQSNAYQCSIGELKEVVKSETGFQDDAFTKEFYTVRDKKILWDTLYAENVISETNDGNNFKGRIEATIIISEIMERKGLKNETPFEEILEEVDFIFPSYILLQEEYEELLESPDGKTREEKIAKLSRLEKALVKINEEIRLEDLRNKIAGQFEVTAEEIYFPNDQTASN